MFNIFVAALIFAAMYFFIITEKINRTTAAMVAAVLMLLFGILKQNEAFAAIDFNTIFLLAGMMVIVMVMKRTGIFEYLAVRSAKIAKGDPLYILILLSAVTAVVSAFLDNVTTVILIAPVTFAICDSLGLHPVPFLLSEVVASNIGGTATLIGDPPNIMIGSASGMGFMSFLSNLTPVVLIILAVYLLTIRFIFKKELYVFPELKEMILQFDEKKAILDPVLLKKSLWVMALVILGFIFHEELGLGAATIALSGAAILLFVSRIKPEEIFREVEWSTLFFFIGLFIAVGGVAKVGIIKIFAQGFLNLTGNNLTLTTMVMLWLSSGVAAFVNNISYTATMIPIVKELGQHMTAIPLWWALALGACLGGNGSLTGAAANVIVANISGREGYPITFKSFLKFGMPLMIESVLISSFYLYFRYLR